MIKNNYVIRDLETKMYLINKPDLLKKIFFDDFYLGITRIFSDEKTAIKIAEQIKKVEVVKIYL